MTVVVPDDLGVALSPEWLGAALRPRFPDLRVHAVQRGPVVERLSTNARFTIDATGSPDAPRNLCIKGYFSDLGRAIAFVGEPEAGFYRDLVDVTGVRTLRSVYADIDPATRHLGVSGGVDGEPSIRGDPFHDRPPPHGVDAHTREAWL